MGGIPPPTIAENSAKISIFFNPSLIIIIQVFVLFRDFCCKLQNLTTQNQNAAHKNLHIFKSNAPTLLKLGVGIDYVYTKDSFFAPAL